MTTPHSRRQPSSRRSGGTSFEQPGTREYLFLGLASVLVLFIALAVSTDPIRALLVAVMALSGLLLRFTIAPGIVLVLTGYFLIDPNGMMFVGIGMRNWRFERQSWDFLFQPMDMIIMVSLMTYLITQYRVYSLLSTAVPMNRRPRPMIEGEKRPEVRRPGEHVRESEPGLVFLLAVTAVLMGQFFTLGLFILIPEESVNSRRGDFRERVDRMVLFLWIFILGGTILTALLGYFRMRRARRSVARRYLEDLAWNESYREQTRIQRWRLWNRWWHRRPSKTSAPRHPDQQVKT